MTAALVWGYVHILLLVFWLGADIGVFICANIARKPTYSLETRNALFHVLGIIDLFPRYCFALILASGLTLIDATGLYAVPLWALILAWGLGGLWVALIWLAHKNPKANFVASFRKIHFWGQGVFGAGLLSVAFASLLGGEPVAEKWLAAKILLLGVICFIAMLMSVVSKPFDVAYTQINLSGPTPELEAQADRSMGNTLIVVLVLYAVLFAVAFIGKVKPF